MRRVVLPVLILVLLAAATPAPADQTDSRLKALFSRLQTTKNPTEAQLVEGSIWQIWLETKDAQVESKVAAGVLAMNRGDLRRRWRCSTRWSGRRPTMPRAGTSGPPFIS